MEFQGFLVGFSVYVGFPKAQELAPPPFPSLTTKLNAIPRGEGAKNFISSLKSFKLTKADHLRTKSCWF